MEWIAPFQGSSISGPGWIVELWIVMRNVRYKMYVTYYVTFTSFVVCQWVLGDVQRTTGV